MNFLALIAIIIIIVLFVLLLYLITNKDFNNNQQKPNENKYMKFNQISNDQLVKEEEGEFMPGYTNELMYENNLKDGDYVNQFKEIDFSRIPKSNNQIGFNPEPRDSSEMKLPYADINVNCL